MCVVLVEAHSEYTKEEVINLERVVLHVFSMPVCNPQIVCYLSFPHTLPQRI